MNVKSISVSTTYRHIVIVGYNYGRDPVANEGGQEGIRSIVYEHVKLISRTILTTRGVPYILNEKVGVVEEIKVGKGMWMWAAIHSMYE